MESAQHDHLVERCKTGDKRAQFELYKQYKSAMLRVAWRIARNDFEAEDIVQEAFLKAFGNLSSFKGDATFGAWLKRITINTSINHVKKKQLDLVPFDDVEPQAEEQAAVQHVSVPWASIASAIRKLPPGYRKVLQLYLIEGFDHQEISDILSISEATSKSQFCRAKRKLRHILQHQAPHYEAA